MGTVIDMDKPRRKKSNPRPTHVVEMFEQDMAGIWLLSPPAAEGQPPGRILIATPMAVESVTRGLDNDNYTAHLKLKAKDGAEVELAIEHAALAGDGREIIARLFSHGAHIASGPKCRNAFMRWLGEQIQQASLGGRLTERCGWHRGDAGMRAFVLPDRTVYPTSGEGSEAAGGEPVSFAGETDLCASTKGSLTGWQNTIGRLAQGNSTLTFSLCVALAAPMRGLTPSTGNVAFHLWGDTSRGKTTLLECAASTAGDPPAYCRSWSATANALETLAAQHHHLPLLMDELHLCAPEQVLRVVYQFGNGKGKSRQTKSGALRQTTAWETIKLSNGEKSLDTHILHTGPKHSGVASRWTDIPMPDNPFPNLHGHRDSRAFVEALKQQARAHYGHALPALVQAVLNYPGGPEQFQETFNRSIKSTLADILETVAAAYPGRVIDNQINRVAQAFALVAATGEYAAEEGILPWPPGEAERATLAMFHAWLRYRGGPENLQDKLLIEHLQKYFIQHGTSRFEELNEDPETGSAGITSKTGQTIRDRAGYVFRCMQKTRYFIQPASWKNVLGDGFQLKSANRTLHYLGILKTDPSGNTQRLILPGLNTRTRVYVLDNDALMNPQKPLSGESQ